MEFATVEIHSVPGTLEVHSGPPQLRGSYIDPNGKRGHTWISGAQAGECLVETLEGFCLYVPEGCTREVEHAGPEDGGFDFLWPESLYREQAFSHAVSGRLKDQGFCVVHVPEAEALREEFAREVRVDEDSYKLPEAEMEEAFLGSGAASKVCWLAGGFGAHKASPGRRSASEIFAGGARHAAVLASGLASSGLLDFEPWGRGGTVLARVPLAAGEREQLSATSLREAAPEAVGEHLDFLQRRRLCIMHFLESSGGLVELQHLSTGKKAQVPVTRGRLLVFKHDVMSYSYVPRAGATPADDIVLQAWILEEPPMMRLDHLDGRRDDAVAEYLDGTPLPPPECRNVHIMSCVGRLPGDGKQALGFWAALMTQTDGFTEHPGIRWDVTVYYEPDATQFGAAGKSGTRHGAFLEMKDFATFDNKFFGISDEQAAIMPPQTRILFETTYEGFYNAGHNFESLKDANIGITLADAGVGEWNHWAGYVDMGPTSPFNVDHELWAQATACHGITSAHHMAFTFGTKGPVKICDTACSSSLVSACINHAALRKAADDECREACSMASQAMLTPFPFVGMSAAGMVGRGGRCYTFDMSANGFGRGEGCAGITQKVSDDPKSLDDKLANHCASFVNQDGRSASLTAPNGPSQQACMRNSMRMENILPEDISTMEQHGTGTALGDPIETGSVRAIFRKRDAPIYIGSGKSHGGHLEMAAGSMALTKVLMSLLHMINPPNCHLKELNSHMDMAGFAGEFPIEMVNMAAPQRTAALNAFGFGGTNSHSELWAKCLRGPAAPTNTILRDRMKKGQPWEMLGGHAEVLEVVDCVLETCPRCWRPMCWRCGASDPMAAGEEGKHRCTTIRKEYSSYDYCSDCYVGEYQYGSVAPTARSMPPDDQAIFLLGSWDNWSNFEEMRRLPGGEYVGEVRLGETGFEQFQLIVGEDEEHAITPAVCNATPDARVVGPVPAGEPKWWLLDGRADDAPPGTIYEVRFRWEETSKSISWRRLARRQRLPPHEWTWAIAGTFTDWQPEEMHPSSSKPGSWEYLGQLGPSGTETLHFLRDGDPAQRVYPLRHAADDPSVPVLGPGPCDDEKGWKVTGDPHALVQARLWVKDGAIIVELQVEPGPVAVFRSLAGAARDTYQLVGSFCGWRLSSARDFTNPDPSRPGLLVSTFYISEFCREEFQIVVNRNLTQVLHPLTPSAPGRGFVAGPDPSETTLHWQVSGLPGQMVEVTFDSGAEDNLSMVTCRVGGPMLQ